jgi:hypothetical protein
MQDRFTLSSSIRAMASGAGRRHRASSASNDDARARYGFEH